MEVEFPKRLFRAGNEPLVDHINNSCKFALIDKIKSVLPSEYNEVRKNSVFANILAIHENGLGYSGRLIDSMMCRQLVTKKKHEIWCVFGGKPLRFSLQEFYAVTGLKIENNFDISELENWEDDGGFWSKQLDGTGGKITIKILMDKHLPNVSKWNRKDKIRLVYVCIIAGLVLAEDEKTEISHNYIKLVMDIKKVQNYPWGREAFDLLLDSIFKTQEKLKMSPKSYSLHGFSSAFQIWAMEAIPCLGELLGKKINDEILQFPRCTNWTGVARVSYEDIIDIESTFEKTEALYPYISSTGNFDVCDCLEFTWPDETVDAEVVKMKHVIAGNNNFGEHKWESVEPVQQRRAEFSNENFEEDNEAENENNDISEAELRRSKKRRSDHGAEKRKKMLLCQRAAVKHGGFDEEMKSFLQGLFNASFSSLEDRLEKKIDERLGKLENEVSHLV